MKEYVPLFQEKWKRRPFWMLVGCILVNRTQWVSAKTYHKVLVQIYRTPRGLASANEGDVRNIVCGLGLGTRRAKNLIAFAQDWSRYGRGKRRTTRDIKMLPGCGRYAADSWAIFVEGRRDVRPTDRRLKEFLAHERGER